MENLTRKKVYVPFRNQTAEVLSMDNKFIRVYYPNLGFTEAINYEMEKVEFIDNNNTMEHGGSVENKEMLMNQSYEVTHHAKELSEVIKKTKRVEPWVVAKMERATTDLSDITHYLDGERKMATGGQISNVSEWVGMDYSDAQIKEVFEATEEAGYDFPRDFKTNASPFNDFEPAHEKVDEIMHSIRIYALEGDDMTKEDIKNILWGIVMSAHNNYEFGGYMYGKQGYQWISPRVKELTDKLSRENKNDVVRIVVDYHVNKNEKETIDKLRVVGAKYSRENDNETARNVAEIATIIMDKDTKMEHGGEIAIRFKNPKNETFYYVDYTIHKEGTKRAFFETETEALKFYDEIIIHPFSDMATVRKESYNSNGALTESKKLGNYTAPWGKYKRFEHGGSMYAEGGSIEVGDKVKATKEYGGKSGVVIEKRGSFVVVEDSKGKTESYHESDLVKKMAEGGSMYADGEILNSDEEEQFQEWLEDGNVSKFEDGYATQDAGYGNRLKTIDDVREYFKREFLSYAKGGKISLENQEKITKLEKVLSSNLVPESIKEKARLEIERLKNEHQETMIDSNKEEEVKDKTETEKNESEKLEETGYKVGDTGVYSGKVKEKITIVSISPKIVTYKTSDGKKKGVYTYKFEKYYISDKNKQKKMKKGGSMYAVGGEILGRNITFEDWKGDTRKGKVISVLDNGDYEVSTDSGMALVTSDEIIKMKKGGYVPKSKKLTARQQAKLEKVLHEFKMGELHSGSKTGPIVKSRKQALAIGLAEARSVKMARGGNVKELSFDNSNLYFYGFGRDTNGNTVVKVGFPNQKAFSIQINNPQFRNTYSLKSNKVSEISESDLNKIEKEVVDYIKSFGSAKQKSTLKVYSGLKMAQGGGVGNTTQKVSNETLLKSVIDGQSKSVEGVKMSKSMAESFLNWLKYSAYGKQNKKLAFHKLLSASFNWGLERYVDKSLKSEYNLLKKEYSKHEQGGSTGWKHKMA